MKKLLVAVGLGLISGSLYAACMGPFCYDDTGASIGGLSFDGNGNTVPSLSSATIAGLTPKGKGQLVFCTSCVSGNSQVGALCVSTSTTAGGNDFLLLSTATANTQCK